MSVHVLYRMFDHDGELLYVGITNNPVTRFREHGNVKDWWSRVANIGVTTFESREDLEAAERAAITDEKPRYNIANAARPGRRRVPPPYALMSAVRGSLGYGLWDMCDRVQDQHGLILTTDQLAAWEEGASDLSPELVAAYMDVLGMAEEIPVYAEAVS